MNCGMAVLQRFFIMGIKGGLDLADRYQVYLLALMSTQMPEAMHTAAVAATAA